MLTTVEQLHSIERDSQENSLSHEKLKMCTPISLCNIINIHASANFIKHIVTHFTGFDDPYTNFKYNTF